MRRIASACAFLCLFATAAVAWGSTFTGHRAQPGTKHAVVRKLGHKSPKTKGKLHRKRRAKHHVGRAATKVTALTTTAAVTAPAAALFGDQTVEASADANPAGSAEAFPFTTNNAGTTQSISVYVASNSSARTLVAAVYADASGHPGASLAYGSLSSPKAGSWNAVSVTSAAISAGRTYWIVVLGLGGQLSFRDRVSSTCRSETSKQSTLTSLSSSWSSGATWGTCPVSAYVTGPITGSSTTTSGQSTPTSTTTSTPSTLPTILPPVDVTAPTVSGNAVDGQTLTASAGTWLNDPTSYRYRWQDCDTSGANCSTISGATGSSYTLTDTDIAHTVRVVVTAANTAGSASSQSSPTGSVSPPAAPSNTGAPALSGMPQQGSALTTSNGSWTGNPTLYSYQWQDCDTSGANCSTISGATGSSYTLTANDVGDTVRSVVTAGNAGGSTSAKSAATATVTAPPPPAAPSNTAAPAISGTDQQGSTLTTSKGSWTGSPTSYSYQWQDCDTSGANCSTISGATGSSYTLTANDVGDTVRSVVTAGNAGGTTSASSAASGTVTSSGSAGSGAATATQVGAPGPAVSCTRTLSVGSNVESALQSASPGSVICLAAGNWSDPNLSGIAPSSNITLAAAPGATVNLASLTISGTSVSKNLTVQGFHIGGVSVISGTPGGLVFQYNTLENLPQDYAFYFYADGSGNGFTQSGVKILYNQMDYVGDCLTVAGGDSMEQNFTFSHNVCGPHIADGDSTSSQPSHYIEIGGVNGITADNNAFEGPMDANYIKAQLHNNVFHVFGSSSNVDFSNNILWHTESRAQTILIQEGQFSNVTVNNNLIVEDPGCFQNTDCYTESMEIYAPHGMTASNNTVLNSGLGLRYGETCSNGCNASGNSMTLENNIAGPISGQAQNYAIWSCASSCTTDHNVSADSSALGSSATTDWSGSWQTTSWTPNVGSPWSAPPVGYYKPTGLASTEGYQGTIGP